MGFFDSPREIGELLKMRNLSLKKRLGQNFLLDPNVRRRIVAELDLHPGEQVWEIGPGLGSMTEEVLAKGVILRCFEIDHGFVKVLKERYGNNPNFNLVAGDVIKTWKAYSKDSPQKVFGNLPYSAGASLIGDFLENGFFPGFWVFLLQQEVAQRMVAKPGTKEYSSFSVLCQAYCRVEILFDVPPTVFYPRPKVTSSLVRLTLVSPAGQADYEKGLHLLIRAAFSSRRKNLLNTVGEYVRSIGLEPKELFRKAGIDPALRGESLSVEDFRTLATTIQRFKGELS